MNLKIVAERQPNFKAPITILPLFNPPGVSAAASAVIAEGKSETVLPINAAPNARVGKWKTGVLASANTAKGPVPVSSQLAPLEVAPPFVTFAMERTAADQGKAAELFCKITHNTPFPGFAQVKLLGLPAKVVAPDLQITKDTKEAAFKLTIDKTSPPGKHNNIFCQVSVPLNGETVLHNVGGTQLRIDVPLPPKPNEPTKVAAAPPKPNAPPPKRLTVPGTATPGPGRTGKTNELQRHREHREKTHRGG